MSFKLKNKAKKILIMGLPGAGKTFLAKALYPRLNALWINADNVRKKYNDWDFSTEGRKRQAIRMKRIADAALKKNRFVVVDFVCPTPSTRKDFKADYIIWMDTIKKGRFNDTNKMFVKPKSFNYRVIEKNAELFAIKIADSLIKYKWDNKKPTAQLLGRWQPWHEGHQKLLEETIKKVGQVNIMVRDVQGINDNPFTYKKVKKNILKATKDLKQRIKINLVPNITNIFYGRKVGYKIEEIILDKKIQKISATKIRLRLRRSGKLK